MELTVWKHMASCMQTKNFNKIKIDLNMNSIDFQSGFLRKMNFIKMKKAQST